MKLLQAGLPDGPATRGATKVHLLVKRASTATAAAAAAARGGEEEDKQPLPFSPLAGFVPAVGFTWPRLSYARGMLRVKIDLSFEGEEGEEEEDEEEGTTTKMEWQGASGGGQEGPKQGQREGEQDENHSGDGVWWSCTTTISGVAGCSGA